MTQHHRRPVMVIVRDGWGANPNPKWDHANAVKLAETPVDQRLMAAYPHVQIATSGIDVGLPDGVMGNSEVGHQNIGAGRIVEQELMRITGRIRDESFFQNPILQDAFRSATDRNGRVHVMGLCSDGRVHSDLEHLFGLLELSQRAGFPGKRLFVHAFTDGRDTPPTGGAGFLETIENKCRDLAINPIASVIGRFYAMDRDNRWDRIAEAYEMLVAGTGARFDSAAQCLAHHYEHPSDANCTGDEFVPPSLMPVDDGEPAKIRDGDSVIFFNYRGDRPRELTKAFVLDEFPFQPEPGAPTVGFDRGRKLDINFVTMTAYEKGLPVQVAFTKPERMEDILGDYVSSQGLSQFRCAETEKYAHVTFFFNDYRDEPFEGEDRGLLPSARDISTYDQKPAMSAPQITDAILRRLDTHDDSLIILNYANGDMVGHTGNLDAAIRAVETVDTCVGRVVDALLAKGGSAIVTADHGNCEQMINPATGGPHTAHTTYDVELILVANAYRGRKLRSGGRLADIAPTVLELLGLPKPAAMTGESLLQPE